MNASIGQTRNSAIADKPRDSFRDQSRSPNTVPFDVRYDSILVCYSNFEIFDFKNAVTLKTGLRVHGGH